MLGAAKIVGGCLFLKVSDDSFTGAYWANTANGMIEDISTSSNETLQEGTMVFLPCEHLYDRMTGTTSGSLSLLVEDRSLVDLETFYWRQASRHLLPHSYTKVKKPILATIRGGRIYVESGWSKVFKQIKQEDFSTVKVYPSEYFRGPSSIPWSRQVQEWVLPSVVPSNEEWNYVENLASDVTLQIDTESFENMTRRDTREG